MPKQELLTASEDYKELDQYFIQHNIKRIFLVRDDALSCLQIFNYFETLQDRLDISVMSFTDFEPNPDYESVVRGVGLYKKNNYDLVAALGGGSAMDVAKCIKLFAHMDPDINFLTQTIHPNHIKLLAIPTTAGTGSEATRFAVIYYKGEKQSITDESCIPGVVLMDDRAIKTLPAYQRKSTMMDALCHAVESYWSVNSTEESKTYAKKAIQIILDHKAAYLANEDKGNHHMLLAANLAGAAINISQTTAGHAMCYKITSLYGLAHGHAAALCVGKLWPYMLEHMERCVDPRGTDYLKATFGELAAIFSCSDAFQAAKMFCGIVEGLELHVPKADENDFIILNQSVNQTRLKNNPVSLDGDSINSLYHQILEGIHDEC